MSSFAVATFGGFFLLVLLLESAAAGTVHVVGDSIGWTIPQNGASAYENWASSNEFHLGDTLTFNFITNAHDVLEVPKESFDSCSPANPIGSPITTGPANITINSTGNHYYICTFGNHCQRGQKLAITISASPPGASPTPPPTSSAPPPPPPPSSSTVGVFASMSLVLLSIAMSLVF